jgi:creatinine amidohydrolase
MTIPPSRFWDQLTWQDVQALDRDRTVAVLPVAATEQHGPHLPLSVDATINRGVLARTLELLAADLPILVLPPLPVGYSEEHNAFPGTLSVSATTLQQLWTEIGESVHRAGLRKLVIFNSHGGQPQIAQIVARHLRGTHGMMVVVASSYGFGEPTGLFNDHERRHGIHAGASETSLMLHLAPELVRRDKLANFSSAAADVEKCHQELRLEGDLGVGIGWQTQDLNPLGACGDATAAKAEAGRALLEHTARRLATLFAEVSTYPLSALKDGPKPR